MQCFTHLHRDYYDFQKEFCNVSYWRTLFYEILRGGLLCFSLPVQSNEPWQQGRKARRWHDIHIIIIITIKAVPWGCRFERKVWCSCSQMKGFTWHISEQLCSTYFGESSYDDCLVYLAYVTLTPNPYFDQKQFLGRTNLFGKRN